MPDTTEATPPLDPKAAALSARISQLTAQRVQLVKRNAANSAQIEVIDMQLAGLGVEAPKK